jgi:hypothetical protein
MKWASNLYRGPSIDASYQASVHLARRFQRRRFLRNQPIRNKNCLWRPCLLTDRHEMSIIHRGPSIDASWKVLYKDCLLISCRSVKKHGHHRQFLFLICWFLKYLLLWNRLAKMNRNLVEGIYEVCFKLADWFQKRRLLNNFPIGSYVKTMSADGITEHNFGSWPPKDHRWHVCYIGLLVSEEKILNIFSHRVLC